MSFLKGIFNCMYLCVPVYRHVPMHACASGEHKRTLYALELFQVVGNRLMLGTELGSLQEQHTVLTTVPTAGLVSANSNVWIYLKISFSLRVSSLSWFV